MDKNNKRWNHDQTSKGITNKKKSDDISNEERHSSNAREAAMVQGYPRIDTENL